MKPCEHWLRQMQPLMRVPNRTEFRQRLQWLSEGMLHEHLETFGEATPAVVKQQERDDYDMFCMLRRYEEILK